MCERQVLVLQALDVTHHLRFGVIAVEYRMAQDGRLARLYEQRLRGDLRESDRGCRLAGGLGEHGKDGVEVIDGSGLVERNAHAIRGVAEVDTRGLGQRMHLHVVGVHELDRVEEHTIGHFVTQLLQFVRQQSTQPMHLRGNAVQAFCAVVHRVHAGHDREQCLCGADVGSRLLAADMLLARLQRHAQCGVAVGIDRYADDAARHRALVRIAAGKVGCVRTAVAHGHAEALRGTQHHVRAPFARRREQHQAQDIGCHRDGHAVGLGTCDEIGVVMHRAFGSRVLQQCAVHLVAQRHALEIADHQINAERLGTCLQQFDGLRETFVRYEETVLAQFCVLARAQAVQHVHRFGRGRGFVQQGCIGDFHAGQVHDHGLEIQQRFQTSLRNLRLVRRVGGIPAGIFQHVALDYGRHDGVVITQPDITLEQLVLRRDTAQVLQERVLAHAFRQVQRLLQTDGGGHGLVDQRIK